MIRKAKKSDISGIADVLKECYNIDSVIEGKEVFLMETKKGVNYLVAIEDEKVVGIVTWFMHGLLKHGLVELDRIAVLSEFRGKGIAKLLFDALISDASEFYSKNGKKLRKVFLMTHASNNRAHSFYEKMGMKHEATLPRHYYDKEDEWVYSVYV